MKHVLMPYPIAEKCTLLEAIYWIGFNVYPVVFRTENKKDQREDLEHNEEEELRSPGYFDSFFSEKRCQKYGFPKSYVAEYIEEHGEPPYFSSITPEQIKELQKSPHYSKEYAAYLLKEYEEGEAFRQKQQPFQDALEEFFEIHKTELALYLRKGHVKAFGRIWSDDSEEDTFPEHDAIPSTAWKFQNIDWYDNILDIDNKRYIHVLVDVESLFAQFPEPQLDIVKVYSVNGILLSDENLGGVNSPKQYGRPSFNWKQFTEEMVKRFAAGQLPPLQKTCVFEMQEWCIDQWGKAPSETNLKEHITPFYQAIKSQKVSNDR